MSENKGSRRMSREKWEAYKARGSDTRSDRQVADASAEKLSPALTKLVSPASGYHADGRDSPVEEFFEPLSPVGATPMTPLGSSHKPPPNTPTGGRPEREQLNWADVALDQGGFAPELAPSPMPWRDGGDPHCDMLWSPASSVAASPLTTPVPVRVAKAPPPSPSAGGASLSLHAGVALSLSNLESRSPPTSAGDEFKTEHCAPLSPIGGMAVSPVGGSRYTPPPNTPLRDDGFCDSPDQSGSRTTVVDS